MRSKSGKRELPENKLVYEWVKKNFPNALQWRRVRVGPMPNGATNPMLGNTRRFADLVVFDGSVVRIIEAKMRPDFGAVGQLEGYGMMWPETPEFSQLRKFPLKLVFLTTSNDEKLRALVKMKGMEYVIFRPEWADQYLKRLAGVA